MEPIKPVQTYALPISMGNQVTTAQNVYLPAQTTAGRNLVPLRIIDPQRDLDRPAHWVVKTLPVG
jgi:hypothetical protein